MPDQRHIVIIHFCAAIEKKMLTTQNKKTKKDCT